MDAKALGAAAGIEVGTLNAWIARKHVPGVTADAQGRRRDFDIETAMHIAIMADLMRFGFGAPLASLAAKWAAAQPKKQCLITHPIQEEALARVGKIGSFTPIAGFTPTYFDSEEELPEKLAEVQKRSPDGALPGVYMVVNVERIEARMRRAEEEWRKRRTATSGRTT